MYRSCFMCRTFEVKTQLEMSSFASLWFQQNALMKTRLKLAFLALCVLTKSFRISEYIILFVYYLNILPPPS